MPEELNKRKAISKKLRFDVFKRDGFSCQYCGATPPGVMLHVDHIHPVSLGGTNAIDNLITSCEPCNLGKGAASLTSIPESIGHKAEVLAEKMAQVKAFNRLIKAKEKQAEKVVDEVEAAFREYHPTYEFSNGYRRSVRNFSEQIPAHMLVQYMHIACCRINSVADATKYFCGICWKQIKGEKNA